MLVGEVVIGPPRTSASSPGGQFYGARLGIVEPEPCTPWTTAVQARAGGSPTTSPPDGGAANRPGKDTARCSGPGQVILRRSI